VNKPVTAEGQNVKTAIYIFLSFDLGQKRVRLKPLKRDRVVDDGSTLAGLQQTLPGGFRQ
jgi:hypothetical protein